MPAQPAWFHRLPEILEELRELQISHLDRLAVQKLFGVKERRARQLMAGLPGLQAGNAFAAERLALLARFEDTAAGERFQWEISRRERLAQELYRTRHELAARRIPIAAAPDVKYRQLSGLASTIRLAPGKLEITCDGAQDLLRQLMELAHAIANDFERFEAVVSRGARAD